MHLNYGKKITEIEKNRKRMARKKMARKMKGHIKNSQATKTLCSVNVETGSFINAD